MVQRYNKVQLLRANEPNGSINLGSNLGTLCVHAQSDMDIYTDGTADKSYLVTCARSNDIYCSKTGK